jgi:hypothetical protein
VRAYEIGSELWMRERIEHGLDPAEADRPDDYRLLYLADELTGRADQRPPTNADTTLPRNSHDESLSPFAAEPGL